jgi:hypothetical protein
MSETVSAGTTSEPADLDELVTIPLRLTLRQVRDINRQAGLGVFDGKARGEYILGRALAAPHDELLERVHEIRDLERARFRAEARVLAAKPEKRPHTGGPIPRAASKQQPGAGVCM